MSLERLREQIHSGGRKSNPVSDKSRNQIVCVPLGHTNPVLPANWDDHGVVFDLFKLASVLECLKYCFSGLKTFHALGDRIGENGRKEINK